LLVADDSRGINLYKAQLEGMNVAGFEANDYFGFVVSDLGHGEVLNMAAELAPALRSALPSISALWENERAPEIEVASISNTTSATMRGDQAGSDTLRYSFETSWRWSEKIRQNGLPFIHAVTPETLYRVYSATAVPRESSLPQTAFLIRTGASFLWPPG
jgi:hypothetical protein